MTTQSTADAVDGVIAVCDTLAGLLPETYEEFAVDLRTQWAVAMGLIRVGEGVNRFPSDLLARFDGQPWRLIVGMRNVAAHQYDDLNPERVWRTVTKSMPELREYLAETVLPALVLELPDTPTS